MRNTRTWIGCLPALLLAPALFLCATTALAESRPRPAIPHEIAKGVLCFTSDAHFLSPRAEDPDDLRQSPKSSRGGTFLRHAKRRPVQDRASLDSVPDSAPGAAGVELRTGEARQTFVAAKRLVRIRDAIDASSAPAASTRRCEAPPPAPDFPRQDPPFTHESDCSTTPKGAPRALSRNPACLCGNRKLRQAACS